MPDLRQILGARASRRLARYWIQSTQDVFALAETNPKALRRILRVNRAELHGLLGRIQEALPPRYQVAMRSEILRFPVGFVGQLPATRPRGQTPYRRLDRRELQNEIADLPSSVNLISELNPIRDQGRRGTCVAHGALVVREFLSSPSGSLSPQHLYYHCKQRDGLPAESGTFPYVAFEVLHEIGVCREETWPYQADAGLSEAQGPPPPPAEEEAGDFRTTGVLRFHSGEIDCIKVALAGLGGLTRRPVEFAVPLYESVYNAETQRSGKMFLPLPGDESLGGHAMCIVGYKEEDSVPGGGFFILRNSWGTGWGYECDYGAGYGTIPFAYVTKMAREIFSATVPGDAGLGDTIVASRRPAAAASRLLLRPRRRPSGTGRWARRTATAARWLLLGAALAVVWSLYREEIRQVLRGLDRVAKELLSIG